MIKSRLFNACFFKQNKAMEVKNIERLIGNTVLYQGGCLTQGSNIGEIAGCDDEHLIIGFDHNGGWKHKESNTLNYIPNIQKYKSFIYASLKQIKQL